MVAYFALSNPCILLFFVLSSVTSAFSPNWERIRPIHHGPTTTTTTLYGGYDATIGANPNTPIQVYCNMKKTDEECRTLICLAELDIIQCQIIEVMDPKPDWFLRIHPSGTTPALRNPAADTDEIICNSSPEKDEVNEYLCQLYETLSKGLPCPLSPSDAKNKTRFGNLRTIFYSVTKPRCLSYLENEDIDKDDRLRQEMEDALGAFVENGIATPGSFFLGDAFTLLDANLISSLGPILSVLKASKGYELRRECFPKLTSWLELCNDRASVKSSVDSATKAGLESVGKGSNEI
jgi:glutathione S-transferase